MGGVLSGSYSNNRLINEIVNIIRRTFCGAGSTVVGSRRRLLQPQVLRVAVALSVTPAHVLSARPAAD